MDIKVIETLLRNYLQRDTDEKLLQFVAANAHSVLFWHPERFCEKAGVGISECADFFSAFGVSSLEAFKNILRNVLYQDMQDGVVTKRSIISITNELIETEIENLKTLAQSMDYNNLQRLTHDIAQATEVVVLGNGGTAPYAIYLTDMLNKLGVKAQRLKGIGGFLNSHDGSTLVISFGIARYSKNSVLQLRSLRQRGYRVVGFTDRYDSPWVDLSDYCFFMPLRGFDFVDSYTAGTTLINALLLNLGLQDEQNLIAKLNTFDSSMSDMDIMF